MALLDSPDAVRLGLRAGDLSQRVAWFGRLLALCPTARARDWVREQVAAAQWHALANERLHTLLDHAMFEPRLPPARQVHLWALWLSVLAPGAISLDARRRAQDLDQAMRWAQSWRQ